MFLNSLISKKKNKKLWDQLTSNYSLICISGAAGRGGAPASVAVRRVNVCVPTVFHASLLRSATVIKPGLSFGDLAEISPVVPGCSSPH